MEGNSDGPGASTLEAQPIGETGGERASTPAGAINRVQHLSSRSLIITVEQYG